MISLSVPVSVASSLVPTARERRHSSHGSSRSRCQLPAEENVFVPAEIAPIQSDPCLQYTVATTPPVMVSCSTVTVMSVFSYGETPNQPFAEPTPHALRL